MNTIQWEEKWAEPINGKMLPEGWLAPSRETLQAYHLNKALGLIATSEHVQYLVPPIPEDEITSQRTRDVADKLFRVAEAKRKAGDHLVGLAAPQIGVKADIFIADVSGSHNGRDLGELRVFVNARAEVLGDTVCIAAEGCFSCPHIFGRLERPEKIGVTARKPNGQLLEAQYEAFAARVFLHEQGHIAGQLFPEETIHQKRALDWVPLELRQEYGQHCLQLDQGEESEWPYEMSRTQWWAMRIGSYSLDNFRATA